MILHPLHRRFGHGAARLAISTPAGGPTLSHLARTAERRENFFAAAPTLLCAGFALLLALTTIQLDSSDSPDSPRLAMTEKNVTALMTIELWSPAVLAPSKEILRPKPAPEVRPVPPAPLAPDQEQEFEFDSSSIAMRALSSPPTNIHDSSEPAPPPGSSLRPSFRPSSLEIDQPALLASSFTSPKPPTIGTADALSTNHSDQSRRPGTRATQDRAPSMANLSRSDNGRKYLAARAAYEAVGPQAPSPSRIPAVSAAGMAAVDTANRAVRDELGRATYQADWQEVPLDELPDCNPPGRQDLLKKRILLAAPFERECSHQDGSYRFIETRNLGAFLMWSRPNPDRSAVQPRASNVCDVLESALRCLDGSPIEESTAQ